jgi:transcriptional regulator with XRE-family HTH domain
MRSTRSRRRLPTAMRRGMRLKPLRTLDCITMRAFAERLGVWAAGEPLFRRYTRNIEATEPENLSVYSIAAQEAFYGKGVGAGVYRLVDGTDCLPRALADAFCALGGDLRLNALVEAVEQASDGVRVYARQAGKLLTVQASYAIVALPFPVLTQLEWRPRACAVARRRLAGRGQGRGDSHANSVPPPLLARGAISARLPRLRRHQRDLGGDRPAGGRVGRAIVLDGRRRRTPLGVAVGGGAYRRVPQCVGGDVPRLPCGGDCRAQLRLAVRPLRAARLHPTTRRAT